jgi:hypothetical protein
MRNQSRNAAARGHEADSERGMALVFALLGVTLISMLAASLLFVTSAGTFGSLAFKSQMQASFAANTGAQKALDWIRTYYAPNWIDSSTGISGTASYVTTVQPPTYNGHPVTLGGSSPNFPDTTVKSNFASLSTSPNNQITMGNATASYTLIASLLTHDRYTGMDGIARISERWKVSITGTVAGPLGDSTVQETVIIERMFIPTYKDAIRGQCNVSLGGDITTDSYFSSSGGYGGGNLFTGAAAQASVGSNSFIQDTGNAGTINGNAYYGNTVGSCSGAASFNHPNVVLGQILQVPGVPFPAITPAFTDTTNSGTSDCGSSVNLSPNGLATGPTSASPPLPDLATPTTGGHYRNCSAGGHDTVTLCVPDPSAGTQYFFFNKLSLGAQSTLQVMHRNGSGGCNTTVACSSTSPCAPVRIYVNQTLSLGGGGVAGMVPNNPPGFEVLYSGTADASFTGNSDFYGTIYAPNASLELKGGAVVYGAVSAKNVTDSGNVTVHYDLTLQTSVGDVTLYRIINQTRNVF